MATMTISEISKQMRDIDFAVLSTHSDQGTIAGRPMSNNRDVDYSGDSFFFSFENARTISDIERNPKVALAYSGSKGLLGKTPLFITVEGTAELIRDKTAFEKHWTKDLVLWFGEGVDTPGLVLIKVKATRIHFWNGNEDGEVSV